MTDDELAEYYALRSQHIAEREAGQSPPRADPIAEALAQPAESVNSRHRRELAERDAEWAAARVARERSQRDAMRDWSTLVDEKIVSIAAPLAGHVKEAVGKAVAEFEQTYKLINRELEVMRTEIHSLRISNAELRASNARLRVSLQQEFMHDSCQSVAAGRTNGVGH